MGVATEMAIRIDEVDLDRDRDLVLRYQAGDPDAFDDLYRRYFDRLHGYCTRRVGDRHTAEELAQEAFVRALRAMPRFAGERRFYPWMTVIAQRLCIDHQRRHGRVEVSGDVDAGSVEPEHDLLFHQVDRQHLATALGRIAPRHREVLDLREQQGLSYAEIAEHLAVPVSTVEALLHRARKALRREYLAVAGRDRLWGLPIPAALAARISGWRSQGLDRVPEALGWAAPAVAAAVTAAVVALPGLGGGTAVPEDLVVQSPTSAQVHVVDTTPPAPPPSSPAPAPTAPVTSAPGTEVTPPPTQAPPRRLPPPDASIGPARAYTDPGKVAEVQSYSETMPLHGTVMDLFYGLNPLAAIDNIKPAPDDTASYRTRPLGGNR
jgi:RNA polymerase sigma-70 factor (ECF subfamily)